MNRALGETDGIPVLIKLKEASDSPYSSRFISDAFSSRHMRRQAIRKLQSRFESSFSENELRTGMRIVHKLNNIPWIYGTISHEMLERLKTHPNVASIVSDISGQFHLAESGPLVESDIANHTDHTGNGVSVAVIDSGIDTDHPDLIDSIVWEECFSTNGGCPVTGGTRASGPGSAEDVYGHGTHVSGIITSSNTNYKGIAPDAGIVAIRVSGADNVVTVPNVVDAIDWVIDNKDLYNIRVINMSLGFANLYEGVCDSDARVWPLRDITEVAKSAGIVLLASSGNSGSDNRMRQPACISHVVSVGAVYDADVGSRSWAPCTDETTEADQIVCFSDVSTALDILAPGSVISSTKKNGIIGTESGTSMASPHAAGLAALLLENNPELTPDELLGIMSETGTSLYDDRIDMWFPRINIAKALGIDIHLTPISHDFGYIMPNHTSDSFQFTVTNRGDYPLELGNLTITGSDAAEFIIDADNCSNVFLAPSESRTVEIRFSPTSGYTKTASLEIPSDDPEATLFTLALSGRTGQAYYVNDTSTTKDMWCIVPGDDSNSGLSPSTPKASVQAILDAYDLEPGDVVNI